MSLPTPCRPSADTKSVTSRPTKCASEKRSSKGELACLIRPDSMSTTHIPLAVSFNNVCLACIAANAKELKASMLMAAAMHMHAVMPATATKKFGDAASKSAKMELNWAHMHTACTPEISMKRAKTAWPMKMKKRSTGGVPEYCSYPDMIAQNCKPASTMSNATTNTSNIKFSLRQKTHANNEAKKHDPVLKKSLLAVPGKRQAAHSIE
mmetsp:Transcript_32547/g.98386  ORF Transcript_32547/g.98386 Transcript_32547/m.98386 type:complete len:209 (+) Transcript_32547:281-907(+)